MKNQALPNALVVIGYAHEEHDGGEPCPNCSRITPAYEINEDAMVDGKRVPKIPIESGDPRLYAIEKAALKNGMEGLPSPTLSANGAVYFAQMGLRHYAGILRAQMNLIQRQSVNR